jgi:hypothetical protein
LGTSTIEKNVCCGVDSAKTRVPAKTSTHAHNVKRTETKHVKETTRIVSEQHVLENTGEKTERKRDLK